jgi:hypothetical protein
MSTHQCTAAPTCICLPLTLPTTGTLAGSSGSPVKLELDPGAVGVSTICRCAWAGCMCERRRIVPVLNCDLLHDARCCELHNEGRSISLLHSGDPVSMRAPIIAGKLEVCGTAVQTGFNPVALSGGLRHNQGICNINILTKQQSAGNTKFRWTGATCTSAMHPGWPLKPDRSQMPHVFQQVHVGSECLSVAPSGVYRKIDTEKPDARPNERRAVGAIACGPHAGCQHGQASSRPVQQRRPCCPGPGPSGVQEGGQRVGAGIASRSTDG